MSDTVTFKHERVYQITAKRQNYLLYQHF